MVQTIALWKQIRVLFKAGIESECSAVTNQGLGSLKLVLFQGMVQGQVHYQNQ